MSTTVPGQGHKGSLTLGKEATFGGGASPQWKFDFLDFEYTPNKLEIDDESITGSPELKDIYLGGYSATWSATLLMHFDGFLEILRGAHGSYSQALVPTDTSARDHTYKTADQLPFYAADIGMGDVPTGKVTALNGVKILGYEADFDLAAGKAAIMKVNGFAANVLTNQDQRVVTVSGCSTATNTNLTRAAGDWNADIRPGMNVTGTNIPAGTTVVSITSATVCVLSAATTGTTGSLTMTFTPNAPKGFPIMSLLSDQSGLTRWSDGTGDPIANVRARSINISYQTPHDTDRFYGALNPDEPLRSGITVPKITVVQEFLTRSAFDQHKAHTSGSVRFVFKHPTLIGSTSTNREIEWRMPRAYLSQPKAPIAGPGKMILTNEWRGTRDTTDAAAMVVRVRNLEPALV